MVQAQVVRGGSGLEALRQSGVLMVKGGRPLADLRPEWISPAGREMVGVTFACPTHPHSHRLCLWFDNPGDGGPSISNRVLYWREGEELEHLTLVGIDNDPAIDISGHWRGWIIEGWAYSSALVSGIG